MRNYMGAMTSLEASVWGVFSVNRGLCNTDLSASLTKKASHFISVDSHAIQDICDTNSIPSALTLIWFQSCIF